VLAITVFTQRYVTQKERERSAKGFDTRRKFEASWLTLINVVHIVIL